MIAERSVSKHIFSNRVKTAGVTVGLACNRFHFLCGHSRELVQSAGESVTLLDHGQELLVKICSDLVYLVGKMVCKPVSERNQRIIDMQRVPCISMKKLVENGEKYSLIT